ncbi:MAG: CvpA family protein [Erysipelotrichaceae bacterium]|nr:CvpA family protein [Erysipelotrichaceae bacterium]MCI9524922.1 CvpA family protein [Erysipelotrichaceae bacterium]
MIFPMDYIVLINIVVIVLIGIFAYSGYKQGLILKALGCIGFVLCGFVAWILSSPFSKLLHLYPSDMTPMSGTIVEPIFYDTLNRVLVFVILFLILSVFILFMKPILSFFGKLPLIKEMNILAGCVVGALQGLIAVMVMSFVFSTPLFANGSKVIEQSLLQPVDVLTKGILFLFEDHMEELQSIQKIVTPSTILNEEDMEHIKTWLLRYDLPEDQIDAFINELAGN